MKLRSLFLSIFILLANIATDVAWAGETFSWKDAVLETGKNHPDLVAARERLSASGADKAIVASAFWPQVAGDIGASRSKSSTSPEYRERYTYGVSATQLVFDGFKTFYDVEQAAKNIQADEYNYRVVSSDVRLNLRTAYVNLLKAQESVRITEAIAERRKKSRNLIRLKYEAGREHKGSLLTAEANLAQATFEWERAKRNLILAGRRMSARLGRTDLSVTGVTGDWDATIEDRQKPDLETLAEANPFLRQLVVLKEAAKWGVKSAQADLFPQIYASAGMGRSSDEWPPEEEEWSFGATVSIPIFEGGRRVATVSKAGALAEQAKAIEQSGRLGVILTLEETWNAWQDAIDNVSVNEKFLNAARERERIAAQEYSTGLITFNDWIIIEDNLVRAENTFLDSRANALIAEANWQQAIGDTLDEE